MNGYGQTSATEPGSRGRLRKMWPLRSRQDGLRRGVTINLGEVSRSGRAHAEARLTYQPVHGPGTPADMGRSAAAAWPTWGEADSRQVLAFMNYRTFLA